eukprot:gene29532-36598_t
MRLNERNELTLGSVTLSLARAGSAAAASESTLTGLSSTDGGHIEVTTGSADVTGTLTLANVADVATVKTSGAGAVRLSASGADARIVLQGGIVAGRGGITLAATETVDQGAATELDAAGDIVIRAANGLRLVDATGAPAAGTFGRSGATGVLRIEGNQRIAANQHLALRLSGATASQIDRLEVTGTLTMDNGATLDVSLSNDFLPQRLQHFALVQAGDLSGQFTQGTGLFGFGDGSGLLQLTQEGSSLVLDAVQRPLADQLSITAHGQNDMDMLGMFFNADYFGTSRSYDVGMTLQAADFLTVDGRFALRSSLEEVTLANGTAKTQRWLVGGANLMAFVGLNGPYRLDTDHDGNLDEEKINPFAAGFELTGVDIGLALYQEKTPTGSASPRGWLSLNATSQSATEYGVPLMDFQARNMAVAINVGTDGQNVVDHRNALTIETGVQGKSVQIKHLASQGALVRASADFEFQIADFISASGSMGLEKSTRDVVLADGKYEVAAYGRNITGREQVIAAIDFNNLTGIVNEPRTYGVQFKANF